MQTQFFIDRQFGHPIYLKVVDGIFIGCLNQGSLEKNLDTYYQGKSISFLKEDFEGKMKSTYTCVKNVELSNLLQKRQAIEMRMTAIRTNAAQREGDFRLTPEEKQRLAVEKQFLDDCNYQITREKKVLAEVHGFDFN